MEVQTCAFESPTITNPDYYYGKINIGSVIMCFLIIYSTALSIVLSVKQLIQVSKEEEESMVKVDVQTQVIKEVVKEVVKVDVQTQVDKEEEEKERKKREQKEEEELLLANYNAKERALALQAAYDERAKLAFEKWQEAYHKLFIIQKRGGNPDNSDYLSLMSKVQEEYLETNEKSTRYEAFNALKKARLIDLNCNSYKGYAHLFNS